MQEYLSSPSSTYLFPLVRRVLTALMHHVKNADQYVELGDAILAHLISFDLAPITEAGDAQAAERLARVLKLVAIPAAVRQGSRLTGEVNL